MSNQTRGVQETIDLALRLHPDTQAVAVISRASGQDNDWFQAEHSELLRHRDKVTEIDLLGPARPELLQRVAELPPHTVVLFQLYPEDANQPAFGALDVLAAVARAVSHLFHLAAHHRGTRGRWRSVLRSHDRCGLGWTISSTSPVWGESGQHSCCAKFQGTRIGGLAAASPMEHRRVGFAAGYPGLVPRTHTLGAGQEILPCGNRGYRRCSPC